MKILLSIIIPYLIGSFSPAYWIGKLYKGIDIRSHGSGNAGTTNALRVLGRKMGAFTFAIDVLKGILAAIIGARLFAFNGMLLASIFVVLGHNWPIFLNFKGGKGVATSFGVLLIIDWKVALISMAIAISVVILTRYVSLASIIASISAPILVFFISDHNKYLLATTLLLATLSVFRHRSNILRLIDGNENKLVSKNKEAGD